MEFFCQIPEGNLYIFVLNLGIFVLNFGMFVLDVGIFVPKVGISVLNFGMFVLNFGNFALNPRGKVLIFLPAEYLPLRVLPDASIFLRLCGA